MDVQVWYTVPVACHVDTETGRVTRVVIIDESIKLDEAEGVTVSDYSAKVDDTTTEAAIAVAERDVWPEWEYGY